MSPLTALFDACVLYPAPLRDFLMHLALAELFRARWSEDIHGEWIEAVLEKRPDLSREQLMRTEPLMDSHVHDCLVTGYEELIPSLQLPDPDDRHVLAAAIRCNAAVIVTFNLRDFPEESLTPYGIEAQYPNDFLCHLLALDPAAVRRAFDEQLASLRNPPQTREQLMDTLCRCGL